MPKQLIPQLLTSKQLCELLQITANTLRATAKITRLPYVCLPGKDYRYNPKQVRIWLNSQKLVNTAKHSECGCRKSNKYSK